MAKRSADTPQHMENEETTSKRPRTPVPREVKILSELENLDNRAASVSAIKEYYKESIETFLDVQILDDNFEFEKTKILQKYYTILQNAQARILKAKKFKANWELFTSFVNSCFNNQQEEGFETLEKYGIKPVDEYNGDDSDTYCWSQGRMGIEFTSSVYSNGRRYQTLHITEGYWDDNNNESPSHEVNNLES